MIYGLGAPLMLVAYRFGRLYVLQPVNSVTGARLIKNALKMGVMNNHSLSEIQKQQAIDNIDRAANQADWIEELLRRCGYIG